MSAAGHAPVHRSADAARAWRGVALLSRGFRPFFLGAGVWALVGMALWPAVFSGAVTIPTAFSAVDWHAHEMIFGYGGAVVAGFLLTAIPNWTGRLPVAGVPLAALAALWAAGRIAVFASAPIGRTAAAAVDAGFLVVFAALVAREVVAGKNWRNLKVAVLVLALALANVAFHVEDAREGLAEFSIRAALGLIVMLILLIGGRVTPSFTGNWIARMGAGARPVPFGRPDGVVMALSGFALLAWVAAPEGVCHRRPDARGRRRQPLAPVALAGARRPQRCACIGVARGLPARRARVFRRRGERFGARAGSLRGGRACLGGRRGRDDDAGDDDAGDARPHRPRAGRLQGHDLRLSLRRPRACRPPRHGVLSRPGPAADACRRLRLGGRLRRLSARLRAHADAPKRPRLTRTRRRSEGETHMDVSDTLAERVVDQAGDAVIYADRSGIIRRWNRAAATLFGFAAEEALGQSLDLVIPDHLRAPHWRGFEAAMASGALKLAGRPTSTRAAHKSGRKLYVEMTFALVVKDGAAEGSVAIARDVTERVERERATAGGGTLPAS